MPLLLQKLALLTGIVLSVQVAAAQDQKPHNVILFVPDGLRALSVTPESAPTLAAVRDQGVNFRDPHSLFPTFTMPNSSGLSTGHHLGDTGTYSNTVFTGYPVGPANNSVTPFIENDAVLGDIDEHFAGNYVNEEAVMKAARARGFSTAAIGKVGPTLMFDHTERSGRTTIIVDDATGTPSGIPLSDEVKTALAASGLPLAAPSRGDNGKTGNFNTPGTTVANVAQQRYFADVATKVVLPMLKARNKPFVLVLWSRDPDGTQHNQGDSLNAVTPGINGATSAAAVRNVDDNLKQLRDALDALGLADDTDVVVAADHGFSTISKESATSPAAKGAYADVPKDFLPPGFLAIDIAKGLGLPLFDPDSKNARVADNAYPKVRGNGLIGQDPANPDVVVAANGGIRPRLPAHQGPRARKAGGRSSARPGLRERRVRRRRAWRDRWHVAAVGDQSRRRWRHGAAVDRRQLPVLLNRLRAAARVHGGNRRHRVAARPGHARQFQPRGYHELHGCDRAKLQARICRRGAGEQC